MYGRRFPSSVTTERGFEGIASKELHAKINSSDIRQNTDFQSALMDYKALQFQKNHHVPVQFLYSSSYTRP